MLRRITLAMFTATVLLGMFPQFVSADGMILPDLATIDHLIVRYHDVSVNINDTLATTQVDQEFYNPYDYPVTGNYIFPIPPGAAVTDFKAKLGSWDQTIIRQNSIDSTMLLNRLIAERKDASLLQYTDWETLTFEVVVPPRSSRKMTLSYQEVLSPAGGMLHYHYVLSTERYSLTPLERASINIDIKNSNGIGSIYSSSHNISTQHQGQGKAHVEWVIHDEKPESDFHLFITPAAGGFGSGFLTGHHQDTDHFLFMFSPEHMNKQRPALPKDIVFVIDRSGSMAGEKIQQARGALHFILDQLNENDRFCIVGFDDVFATVADTLLPVNNTNLDTAHNFVSSLYDRNGTNIDGALQLSLDILKHSPARGEASQMIVFLTDGLPTEGITDPSTITNRIWKTNQTIDARLHVFGVGYDVNTHLLDQLAGDNGGSVTYVQPGENLENVLAGFYERIAYPVLTDITIDFNGITISNMYPQQIPDLFEGSTLTLVGRYNQSESSKVVITVGGQAQGEQLTYTYETDLADEQNMSFVPSLWATRRIGHLLDIIRIEGESPSLVEEVRQLGLSYGLVTPYTTFVITAQTDGAASAENMALYGDISNLNRASGRTTIQARIQNQSYQQAMQVDLARGLNVINTDGHSLVQLDHQNIDLTLLRTFDPAGNHVTEEWIASNIKVDHQIVFGSEAFFKLAADPTARAYMQTGNNVLFMLKGEVIQVVDDAKNWIEFHEAKASEGNTEVSTESRTPETSIKIRIYNVLKGILRSLFE
ncbi:MAG: VWA domain-containing protein [Anaerolineae bacterium]|nr:VWA domain-containing protein [Anaerolineae bacterium]